MHDREKPGRTQDPVEEASGESFPASDPPAWTAARAGKPEPAADRQARRLADAASLRYGEVVGLFRSEREARPAADALLTSGFNLVEIGPRRRYDKRGMFGAPASIGLCAAFGAIVAAAVAALALPRGMRRVLTAAAGGAIGAVSAHVAKPVTDRCAARPGWPPGAALLRVEIKTPDERKRAIAILDAHGVRELHASRPGDR